MILVLLVFALGFLAGVSYGRARFVALVLLVLALLVAAGFVSVSW